MFSLTVTRAGGMARGAEALDEREDRELVVEKLCARFFIARENFGWRPVDFLIDLQRKAKKNPPKKRMLWVPILGNLVIFKHMLNLIETLCKTADMIGNCHFDCTCHRRRWEN